MSLLVLMVKRYGRERIFVAIALIIWAMFSPTLASAGYNWGGDGMEVVGSGTIPNGAVSLQSVAAWPQNTTAPTGYSTQFTIPACDDIVNARLVLGLYGGNASYTADVTVTVNGVPMSVSLGGTADQNPEFTASQTNVYGSTSSGAWVVSVPVAADLNTNGAANSVNISATTISGFDGRIVYASLWDVYQKSSLNNTFQYAVAEGSGDIYSAQPGTAQSPTTASRWVDFGSFNTSHLESAQLDALYTYVHTGQDNHLYFSSSGTSNGTLLGGDPAVRSGSTYAPVQANFNVTSNLSPTDNWTKFSVDPADGVTSSAPSVFRPQVAILEATSAAQSSSIWASAISGSWSRAGNWTGGVPNAVDAGSVINVSTSAALTITLDGPQTVGTLVLGNSGSTTVGYTLHGSGSNTLTFNNSPSNAAITVSNGSQVIDAPVVLADNLVVSGSGTLAFSNSGSIKGGYSLTMNGAGGTLILSGTDTYSGGTTVNAGTLIVTSNTALPNGSSLTVGAGGTVIFDPSQVVAAPIAFSEATPTINVVPEPGTFALSIAGLAAGFAIWRRKKAMRHFNPEG